MSHICATPGRAVRCVSQSCLHIRTHTLMNKMNLAWFVRFQTPRVTTSITDVEFVMKQVFISSAKSCTVAEY